MRSGTLKLYRNISILNLKPLTRRCKCPLPGVSISVCKSRFITHKKNGSSAQQQLILKFTAITHSYLIFESYLLWFSRTISVTYNNTYHMNFSIFKWLFFSFTDINFTFPYDIHIYITLDLSTPQTHSKMNEFSILKVIIFK